jgi:ribonuclease P protein component
LRQTFSKDERLTRKYLIGLLYKEGSSFFIHPFRVSWLIQEIPSPKPVQILIAIPKQNYKKSVERNLLKRRIREAYRKNKYILYDVLEPRHLTMILAITYAAKEIVSSAVVHEKIILLLQRLKEENAETAG